MRQRVDVLFRLCVRVSERVCTSLLAGSAGGVGTGTIAVFVLLRVLQAETEASGDRIRATSFGSAARWLEAGDKSLCQSEANHYDGF